MFPSFFAMLNAVSVLKLNIKNGPGFDFLVLGVASRKRSKRISIDCKL